MTVFRSVIRSAKVLLALLLVTLYAVADTMPAIPDCADPKLNASTSAADGVRGRLIVLPGVGNTRFHLAGFVDRAQRQLPDFEIEVKPWGLPFLMLHNLRAHERNIETARLIAADITDWRRAHPDELLYLIGYSGGGGIATLVVDSLPHGVGVDRLLLIAPAISSGYQLQRNVMPHVDEFVVNYASELDLQVGWGTRTFGTIDRINGDSAGAVGFALDHPRLLQWHWSPTDRVYGHRGNHMSYLGRRWQNATLLPALDPRLSAEENVVHWARKCEVQ